MFTYPCGTTYYVTLVTAHTQCILVNQKVKGYFYMNHEKSPDPCDRCYSVPYNRNGTTRMRSNTNITNLGWHNILLRLQICIHMYMSDFKTYGGYFQPVRSEIKNSRWRRPWKCDHLRKQHWGGPGITGSMAQTSKSIQCLVVLNGRFEVWL